MRPPTTSRSSMWACSQRDCRRCKSASTSSKKNSRKRGRGDDPRPARSLPAATLAVQVAGALGTAVSSTPLAQAEENIQNQSYEVLPPAGQRDIAAYRLATDLDNNLDRRQIWCTNAKTRETLKSIFSYAWVATRRTANGSRNSMPIVGAVYGSQEQQCRGARAVG